MRTDAVRIDVWSDYVCPFCYLELPVLEQATRALGEALAIEWHAFELRPDPAPTLDPAGEYLRTTWARSVYPMAAQRGMTLRLPPVQPRSRKAFEAVEHARSEGRFDAMHRALFQAFFEDGRDIGSIDVLVEAGRSVGLEAPALRAALDDGRFAAQVLHDQSLAQRLGVRAVPLLAVRRAGEPLERARALSGAVSHEQLAGLVAQVRGAPASP
jgi:predicted DsbA family dithiol-disulfide isomerase